MIIYLFSKIEQEERMKASQKSRGTDVGYEVFFADKTLFRANLTAEMGFPWAGWIGVSVDQVPDADKIAVIAGKRAAYPDAVVVGMWQYAQSPLIDRAGLLPPKWELRRLGLPEDLAEFERQMLASTDMLAQQMNDRYGCNKGMVGKDDVAAWIEAARKGDLPTLTELFQKNAGLAGQKLNGVTGQEVAWAAQYDATQVGSQIDPKDFKNLQETVAFLNACAARPKP
jgi:hypothetical protein